MKAQDILITGRPFVSHVDQDARPTLPLSFLNRAYVRFYTNNDNLINNGIYLLLGYRYDFKPYLKLFLYKQHGSWHEAYAPNKTKLRDVIFGRIDRIIDITNI